MQGWMDTCIINNYGRTDGRFYIDAMAVCSSTATVQNIQIFLKCSQIEMSYFLNYRSACKDTSCFWTLTETLKNR